MFQRILVPLDGSARAERALPVAARLARASGGSMILVRVATAAIDAAWAGMEAPALMRGAIEADEARAAAYLAQTAASPDLAGIEVHTQVQTGTPAQHILSVAATWQIDGIILCSHGQTGFQRWMLGSVAQHITRQSPVPVLVLNERGGEPSSLTPETGQSVRVLVALDGSAFSEAALEPAVYLSAALSAPAAGALHLVRVLPFSDQVDESRKEDLITASKQAQVYLGAVARRVREGELAHLRLQVTSSVVIQPDIAEALIGTAEAGKGEREGTTSTGYEVLAVATHGRSGVERWVMGSVTERLLGATRLPLLVVRPRKQEVRSAEKEVEVQGWVGLF